MSHRINTPLNQKRLTNVAVVRLKRGGQRFEIACYPNKVQEWKSKIETDLDEVLQVQAVFVNVSKGILAKSQDLKKHFGTDDVKEVCLFILQKGELQVSEIERKSYQEKLFRDIATIVAEKCINTETNRPLTVGVVERAMKEIHYSLNPNKSAKQQALRVIKLLQEKGNLPIARAKMRLQLTIPTTLLSTVKEKLEPLVAVWETERLSTQNTSGTMHTILECQIDPSHFRELNQLVLRETQKSGSVEVLAHAVMPSSDSTPAMPSTSSNSMTVSSIDNSNNDTSSKNARDEDSDDNDEDNPT
jgi:ribosome maturation protein SDO1